MGETTEGKVTMTPVTRDEMLNDLAKWRADAYIAYERARDARKRRFNLAAQDSLDNYPDDPWELRLWKATRDANEDDGVRALFEAELIALHEYMRIDVLTGAGVGNHVVE